MKKQNIEHTQLLVLSLLSGEDMYGYQMIVELARRSDHTFEMKEGTLYPVLHGLEKEGKRFAVASCVCGNNASTSVGTPVSRSTS